MNDNYEQVWRKQYDTHYRRLLTKGFTTREAHYNADRLATRDANQAAVGNQVPPSCGAEWEGRAADGPRTYQCSLPADHWPTGEHYDDMYAVGTRYPDPGAARVEFTAEALTLAKLVLAATGTPEARCSRCGETFIPADAEDTEHIETADGRPCGGNASEFAVWARALAR